MSGHSKFANIKHKKEKNDAAKGKIFTIIGRELAVAVKEGGSDPNNNSRLRDVIAKAKANNMPNDTIERGIKISIFASQPALVIGTDSAQINAIKKNLVKILKKDPKNIEVSIVEVKNPDLDARLVAKDIAHQLEERGSYRVVQKKAIQRVRHAGAKGCKTRTKGRIGGAEIARYEEYREGVLSLHTLRQPIGGWHSYSF